MRFTVLVLCLFTSLDSAASFTSCPGPWQLKDNRTTNNQVCWSVRVGLSRSFGVLD